MKKLNLLSIQTPIVLNQKVLELTPWNQPNLQRDNKNQQHMPTYRRQIVQNFLGSIKKTKQRNYRVRTQANSLSNQKQHLQNYEKNPKNNKNNTNNLSLQNCMTITQLNQYKKNKAQDQKIFRQQIEKRKKSKIKLKVVNVGDSFQKRQTKRQVAKQFQESRKRFVLKLRIKEEIINSKNSVRRNKKIRAKTVANIFQKNQFLQCQFSNYQNFRTSKNTKLNYPTFCRISTSPAKRSSSVQMRSGTRSTFY